MSFAEAAMLVVSFVILIYLGYALLRGENL
jgi:hypothetical protein